jgi:phosphoglycolate phosphatase
MRILLWDIDGTLVSTGGAGIRALGHAVGASEPATEALQRMRLDGMTDRKIARILCAAVRHRADPARGIEEHQAEVTGAEIDAVLTTYLAALEASLKAAVNYQVLAGVRETLASLEGDDIVHALGTGNLETGARLKLEHGGLWKTFHFGGYGSDAEERADILRAAVRKGEAHLGRA